MAHLDDYLRSMVTPHLQPGEAILGFAHLRLSEKIAGSAQGVTYDEWLGTATNTRLILFRTEVDGNFEHTPRAQCLEVREWRYGDLREVRSEVHFELHMKTWNGRPLLLFPHETLGPYGGEPKRYDLFPATRGLDGHLPFYNNFPKWLEGEVARGAFPMAADSRVALEGLHQRRAFEAAGRARALADRSADNKRALHRTWPLLVATAFLALAPLFGLMTSNASANADADHEERRIRSLELSIVDGALGTWLATGTPPPSDCPERASRSVLAGRNQCHGCNVTGVEAYPSPGKTIHRRGAEWWSCGGVAEYQARAAELRRLNAESQSGSDARAHQVPLFAALTGLMLLGSAGLFAWGAVRRSRLLKAPVGPG